MKIIKILTMFIFPTLVYAAPPTMPQGDNVGYVKSVRVLYQGATNTEGQNAFQVWFKNMTRERQPWACNETQGYIMIREATPNVSSESYKQMFSLALTAQATGKKLAIDSSGNDPCNNGMIAWIVD